MIDIKKLIKSFGYGFRGIARLLATEQNARIHFTAMILVFLLAIGFRVNHIEAAVLFFAVVLVFAMEITNTALEKMLDLLHPQEHETVAKIKDAMAGAVLIAATIAVVVGILTFYPYIRHIILNWY